MVCLHLTRNIKNSLPLFFLFACLFTTGPMVFGQFDVKGPFVPNNKVDRLVVSGMRENGVKPANLCTDSVFLRRVYLDILGQLPEPWEVRDFMQSKNKKKRTALIDALMKRDSFADYWALKWCDILRVKAEFPINLWPNGVQAYYRWIHDAMTANMSYDQFARALLTSSGSNFRTPPVNFYRAIQGQSPSSIASAVALTFMGVRLDRWSGKDRAGMEAFFSRVAYKKTAEWKEEIVYLDPTPKDALKATFPGGRTVIVQPGNDPRQVFADWLIAEDNPWFARNMVNRIWSWFMGRGIIHEPDDIHPGNAPVYPALLSFLEKEFAASGYDMQHVFRLILNSRIYQQSAVPQHGDVKQAEALFACYPVRRLPAEVLIDALCWISGTRESYSSAIPEPFSFVPPENRTITLSDGSITSQFLEMFGRPSRDTGLEAERNNNPTAAQRLHLLNSTHVQGKIERSWRLRNLISVSKGSRHRIINSIYMTVLSRQPTQAELAVALDYFGPRGRVKGSALRNASVDLVWALINGKEFLYRH